MSYNHTVSTERRSFFKTLGVQWAQEIKKAQKNIDFPMSYQGINYRTLHTPNTQGNNVLAMPNFPTIELESQTVFTLEKKFNNNKILENFIQDHAITCVLCAYQPVAIEDTKQIIYRPEVTWQSITNAPSLLLFENDEVSDVVHQIHSLLSQLPAGSDVYIGNIGHDLRTSGTSLTKERIMLFLEN